MTIRVDDNPLCLVMREKAQEGGREMKETARDEKGRLPWCPNCGDAKACFHRPDEVVVEAYLHEMRRAEQKEEKK